MVTTLRRFIYSTFAVLCIATVFSLTHPHISLAATRTWDGGGVDNNWSTCANWSLDTCPIVGDIATFDSTSTKDATVDASFAAASIATLTITTGYSGTITQARSLTMTTGFSQSTGSFSAAGQTFTTATFTLSGGTFTASSGNTTISSTFTVSGSPTFNANGGTVIFSGAGATLTCNNITFNLVTFSKTLLPASTVASSCTLPLGNNPTVSTSSSNGAHLNLNGSLTGTGTLTFTSGVSNNLTISSTGALTGFSGFSSTGTLAVAGATIDFSSYSTVAASATVTVSSGSLSLPTNASAGTLSLSGGTFTAPSGTLTLSGSITVTGSPTINGNGGTVLLNGSTPTIACTVNTFGKIVISTSGITTVSAGCIVPLGANPTVSNGIILSGGLSGSGTLTQTTGQLNMQGAASLTGFTALTGTSNSMRVNGTTIDFSGYSTIDIPQGFTSNSSSVFTMPAIMNVGGTFDLASGTMTAGSGTVNFTGGTGTINCNSQSFNVVTFTGQTGVKTVNANCNLPLGSNPTIPNGITLAGTLSGSGTLTLSAGTLTLNSGAVFSSFSGLSAAALTVSGATANLSALSSLTVSGATTVSSGTATFPDGANLTGGLTISGSGIVVAPSGTLNIGGNFAHTAGTFTHSSGTVNLNGTSQSMTGIATSFYNLTKTLTSAAAATLTLPVSITETVTGTLTLNGYDTTYRLLLRSASSGTRFQLDAQGTRNMLYIDVKDGNSVNVTPIEMSGSGSLDSLNNINFSFNNSAPNAPTTLGPAGVVGGALVTNLQPTLSFVTSDPNPLDTQVFQIQISTVSNFLSTVVDYTSRLLSQGSTSFDVGQQVNGGSYTMGAYGQALATGDYFWRVRTTDNNSLTSSYSLANGGAIAFSIDATPPNDFTPVLTPASPTTTTQPILTFSTTDNIAISQYLIKIDGSAYIARTSPYQLPVMSAGTHTVYVRAYDTTSNYTEKILTLVIESSATPTPTPTATPTPSPTATPSVAAGTSGSTVTASDGSGASIIVGSGVSTIDLTIDLTQSEWTVIGQTGYPTATPESQGFSTVGKLTKLAITSTFNGATIAQVDSPITLTLPYPTTATTTNLTLIWYDSSTGRWSVLPAASVVSVSALTVSNTTRNSGFFAVVATPPSSSTAPSTASESSSDSSQSTSSQTTSPTPTPSPSPSPEPSDTPEKRAAVIEAVQRENTSATEEILGVFADIATNVTQITKQAQQETKSLTKPIEPIAPIAPAVALAATSAVVVTALVVQTGIGFDPDLLFKLFSALGLLPRGRPQGLVYDDSNLQPIPFAMLTFTNQDESIKETTVTNEFGVYGGVKLAAGTYTLAVTHQDFQFPSTQSKPLYLGTREYYQGEPFAVASEKQEQLFLIPVHPKTAVGTIKDRIRLRLQLATKRLLHSKNRILIVFSLFSLAMTVISPTVLNIGLSSVYIVAGILKLVRWLRPPLIVGKISDGQGNPVGFAIIKVTEAGTNQLKSVSQTNRAGEFEVFVTPGRYQIQFIKNGYVWDKYAGSLGLEEVSLTTKMNYEVTLKTVAELYPELATQDASL